MSTSERYRHEEEDLVDLFRCQREANDCNDHEKADALFFQIWAVLAGEPQMSRS